MGFPVMAMMLLTLLLPTSTIAMRCVGCTSDPAAPNEACMGVINATSEQLVTCDPEEYEGNPVCFTMVTAEGKETSNLPNSKMKWNRGCCVPAMGDLSCPTDSPQHDSAEGYWEIWRSWCNTGTAVIRMTLSCLAVVVAVALTVARV